MSITNLKNLKEKRVEVIELLNQLTNAPMINSENFDNIIDNLGNNHNIYVYIKNNKVVGIITLLIEPKIIHNGSNVAHIEDLVVDKKYKNMGIGNELIKFCLNQISENNCYKVILNCSNDLKKYYEKFGFLEKNIQMAIYLN